MKRESVICPMCTRIPPSRTQLPPGTSSLQTIVFGCWMEHPCLLFLPCWCQVTSYQVRTGLPVPRCFAAAAAVGADCQPTTRTAATTHSRLKSADRSEPTPSRLWPRGGRGRRPRRARRRRLRRIKASPSLPTNKETQPDTAATINNCNTEYIPSQLLTTG